MVKEQRDSLKREDSIDYFIVDDSSSDDNVDRDILNGGIFALESYCL